MSTISTAEIRAAARACAKTATEALPDLQAARERAEAERQRAEEALSEANSALSAARRAEAIADATPAAALALIRLVESAPHLIDAFKRCGGGRPVSQDEAAALIRRKLASPPSPGGGRLRLSSLGAQVLRLHAEITEATTENKQ